MRRFEAFFGRGIRQRDEEFTVFTMQQQQRSIIRFHCAPTIVNNFWWWRNAENEILLLFSRMQVINLQLIAFIPSNIRSNFHHMNDTFRIRCVCVSMYKMYIKYEMYAYSSSFSALPLNILKQKPERATK